MHDLIAALKPYESYIRIREHEPMAHHTTFRIGGPADLFLECASGAPLGEIVPLVRGAGVPLYVIGRGSNLLVRDEGVRGAVLCTAEMHEITITGSSTIVAEAGASLFSIASTALRQGLAGAEFAAGIPGTLGGAVFMNAGAYGGQMADLIVRTHYLDSDGKPGVIEGDAHGFGYRESIFKAHPDCTILRAELRLTPGSPAGIREKMQDYAQRRREKQPLEFLGRLDIQAAGGILRGQAHPGQRPDGLCRGRGAGVRKARRLPHQPRRRDLRRHAGADRVCPEDRFAKFWRRASVRGSADLTEGGRYSCIFLS